MQVYTFVGNLSFYINMKWNAAFLLWVVLSGYSVEMLYFLFTAVLESLFSLASEEN